MMGVTAATAQVSVDLATARAAAFALAGRLWSVTIEDVVVESHNCLTHGIRVDGETACWLTWQFTGVTKGWTEVRLIHDELEDGSPEPDLHGVLASLSSAVAGEQSPAG